MKRPPRPGDPVRVEFDGIYLRFHDAVLVEVATGYRGPVIVPAAAITVVHPSVTVGDVLCPTDPEPPVRAVVVDDFGLSAQHYPEGWKYSEGGYRLWPEIAGRNPTVVWLPRSAA